MNNVRYQNEKMKRRYFEWVMEAKGFSTKTIRAKENAIWKYDDFTKQKDYKKFNSETIISFKKWLATNKIKRTELPLDKTTQFHVLRHLNAFFTWLSTQSGYKSKIRLDVVAYLRLSREDSRIAISSKQPRHPSLSYILKLCSFEIKNEIDHRDRALLAFTAISAMRDSAIISLPLECFNPETLVVYQDPNQGVKTKFSKTIMTTLFKFDNTLVKYVLEWYKYLIEVKLFNNANPLFPSTNIEHISESEHSYIAKGVTKLFWSDTNSMRKVFKERSHQMNLEYYSPHKFRHFAISEANKHAIGAEQMKAISQNVGHEKLSTTFFGYGAIDNHRVSSLISDMGFEKKVF